MNVVAPFVITFTINWVQLLMMMVGVCAFYGKLPLATCIIQDFYDKFEFMYREIVVKRIDQVSDADPLLVGHIRTKLIYRT